MSESTTKPNFVKKAVNTVRKHERKILVATTVVSTASAIIIHSSSSVQIAFLKEKGLLEEFDNWIPTEA